MDKHLQYNIFARYFQFPVTPKLVEPDQLPSAKRKDYI